jgi:Bacterial PH domain
VFFTALVAVARFAILVALWWVERIVITNKRVMRSAGIVTHKLGMMPLAKVTDLTYERPLRGRLLGYGNMIIESAGQNQAFDRIDFIPQPEEIYEAISQLVFGEKPKPTESQAAPASPSKARSGLLAPPKHR